MKVRLFKIFVAQYSVDQLGLHVHHGRPHNFFNQSQLKTIPKSKSSEFFWVYVGYLSTRTLQSDAGSIRISRPITTHILQSHGSLGNVCCSPAVDHGVLVMQQRSRLTKGNIVTSYGCKQKDERTYQLSLYHKISDRATIQRNTIWVIKTVTLISTNGDRNIDLRLQSSQLPPT